MQFNINGLEVTVTPLEKRNGTYYMTHHVAVRQEGFSMGFFIPNVPPSKMEQVITIEMSQRLHRLLEQIEQPMYDEMVKYSIPEPTADNHDDEEEEDGVRRRRWSSKENKALLEAYFSNVAYEEIAQRHERTLNAVRVQVSKLLRGGK